jgi:hypothetical protein
MDAIDEFHPIEWRPNCGKGDIVSLSRKQGTVYEEEARNYRKKSPKIIRFQRFPSQIRQ